MMGVQDEAGCVFQGAGFMKRKKSFPNERIRFWKLGCVLSTLLLKQAGFISRCIVEQQYLQREELLRDCICIENPILKKRTKKTQVKDFDEQNR